MSFFAASNSWVTLVVFLGFILLSALSNYLKRKQAEKSAPPIPDDSSSPRRTNQPPPRKATWEEEIQKLLAGETTEESVPPVLAEIPRPVPTPAAPPPLPAHLARNRIPRASMPVPAPAAPDNEELEEFSEDIHARLARLNESAAAYTRASHLTERVTERMRTVDATTEHARPDAPVAHVRRSPEIASAVGLLRKSDSARQAMIASVVFGQPKAFEL